MVVLTKSQLAVVSDMQLGKRFSGVAIQFSRRCGQSRTAKLLVEEILKGATNGTRAATTDSAKAD